MDGIGDVEDATSNIVSGVSGIDGPGGSAGGYDFGAEAFGGVENDTGFLVALSAMGVVPVAWASMLVALGALKMPPVSLPVKSKVSVGLLL